jgi:[ribosomal protein S5]-alanine N-acetyltransferase
MVGCVPVAAGVTPTLTGVMPGSAHVDQVNAQPAPIDLALRAPRLGICTKTRTGRWVQLPGCLHHSRVDSILYTEWSDKVSKLSIRLRPVIEDDLEMFRRFATEPYLIGLDWAGFRDARAPARRFATDGYLGADDSRLMVEVEEEHTAAGFVSWRPSGYGVAKYWEIGIALLPEWRGRGIGWRAQAMLCDYLFHHTPAERIEARTHVENIAEQKALEKAGFQREGLLRSAEFRAGQWRDGWIYSRLRGEHSPL